MPNFRHDKSVLLPILAATFDDVPNEVLDESSKGHTLVASASILHDVECALKTGGVTFLSRSYSREELLEAVSAAVERDRHYQIQHASRKSVLAKIAKLKPRNVEVMNMICDGLPNKSIASRLDLSLRTIENIRSKILKTMGTPTAIGLVRMLADADYFDNPR